MKKILIIMVVLSIVILSGCNIHNRDNYYFEDTGNDITNDQLCYRLCMEKERTNDNRRFTLMTYHCDYEPVICGDGICVCKTY